MNGQQCFGKCSPAIAYSSLPMKYRDAGYSALSGLKTKACAQNLPNANNKLFGYPGAVPPGRASKICRSCLFINRPGGTNHR